MGDVECCIFSTRDSRVLIEFSQFKFWTESPGGERIEMKTA